MSRNSYRNGEPIVGPSGCDDCQALMINGVLCHEAGCPSAWKDYRVECRECGVEFYPEWRGQSICEGCLDSPGIDADDDFDPDEDDEEGP
jgi:hypothetical protein